MPRTGGVYSPPAGTKGVSNTTIQSVPYNAFVDDLTADANDARPVTAGGTGSTTASGARTNLGLAIGTNVQAYDALLQSISGLTTSANQIIYTTATDTVAVATITAFGRSLIDDADAATARTTLGLVIGTNVQAQDAELQAIAGLVSAADRLPYFTGSGTASLATFTAFGRSLVDDADAATARTTLGLVIGTNVQAYDAALAAISGLAFTDGGFIVGNGTTYVIESGATARTSLGVPATTVTLTAGNGLTGGGDLSANRTFTLGTPSDITNSTTNSVTSTSHTHALGFIAAEVSTTTSNSTTSFPLGHVILCLVTATNRNGTAVPALYNGDTIQYVYDGYPSGGGSGAVLSGTWRARGNVGADGRYLLQKVA
ncbi:hypothetical protein [Sinorhizobium fredii]|uniref:hypothetical protein n=1 Tax=Rhizobium fredii TaxID=380 RepID=UPI00210BE046|nr:hypothetical protein [Sinorhizobium fredii]UTY50419.1 hypothetical protein EPK84_28530 [Sinorhizobium fredii]